MCPEEAIRRAFWTIKLPSLVVMVGPWLAGAALAKVGYLPSYGTAGLKWFLPVFLGGFLAGWLVWSIQVPRWRLWAYRAVDDIEELKHQAVASQLIWPEGHFFQKTEIASRRLREQIRSVEAAKSGRRRSRN